jgi:hydroxymethylglutaryl-CoA reductase (NADPH)
MRSASDILSERMPTDYRRITEFLKAAVGTKRPGDIARLLPRFDPPPPRVPGGSALSDEALEQRWALPGLPAAARIELADERTLSARDAYTRNIENFIGTVKVPVGLAGPLRVNGLFAHGDFYVPLATTEAALVASYSRGAQLLTEAGGCTALLLNEGVSRAPGFAFASVTDAALFVMWATANLEAFCAAAAATTRHGRLVDLQAALEGNHVYLVFDFTTGEAAGQNMATIATEAICRYIGEHAPVRATHCVVEANLSGDKKATTQSFMRVRGKKVSAEVRLSAELIAKRLRTTPAALVDYWRMSAIGGVMSGSIGIHGHYANGLAALFIACGQDAACVAEATMGVTRFEATEDGGLYAAVTLPSLIVGTVGGGTGLPSQRACLDVLGLRGPDSARALAEICAGLALAGELSITGALASGEFTRAHQRLARGSAERQADAPGTR